MAENRRFLAAFLWGVPIATLGGLIGLGGAEFRLPVLVGVLHHTARKAVPLNLAVSLTTIGASLIGRAGTLPSTALLATDLLSLAVGSIAAAFVGAGWAGRVSEQQLRRAIVGSGFLPTDQFVRVIAGVFFGVVIGLFSSLLGVAGGELIIPTLLFAFGVDIRVAARQSFGEPADRAHRYRAIRAKRRVRGPRAAALDRVADVSRLGDRRGHRWIGPGHGSQRCPQGRSRPDPHLVGTAHLQGSHA